MDTWWRKLGRPALLGFLVGLFVMTGLAWVAPPLGGAARTSAPSR